jgi:hypothetical protein
MLKSLSYYVMHHDRVQRITSSHASASAPASGLHPLSGRRQEPSFVAQRGGGGE